MLSRLGNDDDDNPRGRNLRRMAVVVGLAVVAVFLLYMAAEYGIIPKPAIMQSAIPKAAQLPTTADVKGSAPVAAAQMPTAAPAALSMPEIRFEVWAWNAMMGLMFANGGEETTAGSLMQKNDVRVRLTRQDDTNQMQNDMAAFAKGYASGNESAGTHFIVIMGDGAAAFLAGLNPELKKLGPEYIAEVIGVIGYSRGEDKFMGPADWKQNPRSAMGGLVSGVLRDGDWNIAMIWLATNQLLNNPDEKTWDPDALNWVNADTYIDAAQKYVSNYCEDRTVVRKGKVTGEKKRVCVQGVVTWTPGDVIVAKNRGGLVSILSTKENTRQMPAVLIGNRKWNREHRSQVEAMLTAIYAGGDQVNTYPAALDKAGAVSAAVYKEKNAGADYWVRYYKGVVERDALGKEVPLGGSRTAGLADGLQAFGLGSGAGNLFAATYKTFGDIVVQQYPKLVPSYPPAEEITNTSYVQAISARVTAMVPPDQPKFSTAPIGEVIGRRSWNIQFDSGKATFTPAAEKTLDDLYQQLIVQEGLAVEIHGHTDSVGGADFNYGLSERRAMAVKQWMEAKAAKSFPEGRVRIVAHGMTNPVASNDSEDGRSRNRRVEIVLGK